MASLFAKQDPAEVSTHSRPKAADISCQQEIEQYGVSTHSRPKAAESAVGLDSEQIVVSTHSRPKAADSCSTWMSLKTMFQHTAARRRLSFQWHSFHHLISVSTHSRPKAAERFQCKTLSRLAVSTHSRPKAAEADKSASTPVLDGFNTQPPEGG